MTLTPWSAPNAPLLFGAPCLCCYHRCCCCCWWCCCWRPASSKASVSPSTPPSRANLATSSLSAGSHCLPGFAWFAKYGCNVGLRMVWIVEQGRAAPKKKKKKQCQQGCSMCCCCAGTCRALCCFISVAWDCVRCSKVTRGQRWTPERTRALPWSLLTGLLFLFVFAFLLLFVFVCFVFVCFLVCFTSWFAFCFLLLLFNALAFFFFL